MTETYYQELMRTGVPAKLPKSDFAFEDLFDEHVANTQKTWAHDRTKSVGASEAFGCILKNWFSKRGKEFGYNKDPDYVDKWGAMRRGDILENHHIVPAVENGLKRRGMDLIMAGEGQDTIIDGTSSATLDGLIINAPKDLLSAYGIPDIKSSEVVLEMKSFDPRIDIKEEKFIHRGQTQMQMGLIREKTKYKPYYAVVLYVNASWVDDVRPFVVPFDENVYLIGRERNEKVFGIDDPKLLHPEGKLSGDCEYCPFIQSCNTVRTGRVPAQTKPLTGKSRKEEETSFLAQTLEPIVSKRMEKYKLMKTLEKEVESMNEEIKQTLIRSNQSRSYGPGFSVSYTTVSGKKTLSKDKIEEAGLNPEDFMVEGAGYEKLTVTVKDEK